MGFGSWAASDRSSSSFNAHLPLSCYPLPFNSRFPSSPLASNVRTSLATFVIGLAGLLTFSLAQAAPSSTEDLAKRFDPSPNANACIYVSLPGSLLCSSMISC